MIPALAGCSQVVNGDGAALAARTPTTSHAGFPSTSAPAAGTPATSAASSTANGVTVTYAAGHLRATFPSQPEERSENGNFGGVNFTVHVALARDPAPTEAACEDTSESIPPSEQQATLTVAVGSFESSSGFTVDDQHATTYRGHVARTASVSGPDGNDYTFLAFFWTDVRLYILFAQQGPIFDTLSSSFQPLP
jgi:hypothetical protein